MKIDPCRDYRLLPPFLRRGGSRSGMGADRAYGAVGVGQQQALLERISLALRADADDHSPDVGIDDDLPVPQRRLYAALPGAEVRSPDRPDFRVQARPYLACKLRFGKVQLHAGIRDLERRPDVTGEIVGADCQIFFGVSRLRVLGQPGPRDRPGRLVYLRHDGWFSVGIEPVGVEEPDGFAQGMDVEPDDVCRFAGNGRARRMNASGERS